MILITGMGPKLGLAHVMWLALATTVPVARIVLGRTVWWRLPYVRIETIASITAIELGEDVSKSMSRTWKGVGQDVHSG